MTDKEITDLMKRRKRLVFRAKHRGIKEADIIIGSFVEKFHQTFSQKNCAWFELMFEETDYDILNWITKKAPPPTMFNKKIMHRMQKIDYITIDIKQDIKENGI